MQHVIWVADTAVCHCGSTVLRAVLLSCVCILCAERVLLQPPTHGALALPCSLHKVAKSRSSCKPPLGAVLARSPVHATTTVLARRYSQGAVQDEAEILRELKLTEAVVNQIIAVRSSTCCAPYVCLSYIMPYTLRASCPTSSISLHSTGSIKCVVATVH